jgi:DNA-3-methyladenine glycosylase II
MVKMLFIFTHGRPNVFPSEDYGVRNGWCAAKKLSEMPKPKEFCWLAECRWPHRTLAAWYR